MRITTTEYNRIWFTSDWHLGHNKEFLYGPRGCESRDEHVKWLLEQINELVEPDDLIIHLGDMSLTASYTELCNWLRWIKCNNIWSLIGNHENNFKRLIDNMRVPSDNDQVRRDTWAVTEFKHPKDGIRSLGKYCELTIVEPTGVPNQKAKRYPMTLCHFPMLLWNNSHHGSFHLCGHSHGGLIPSSPFNPIARRLDCGVENALDWSDGEQVMFDWDDIKNIMSNKEIEVLDHHNRSTT